MADSFITYTGDGSTKIFSIPYGYLDVDHLTATVDGVTTAVTYPTEAQFEFSSAPANGTAVTLTRATPRTTREVVWVNAANLSAGDLNTSDLQLLYITQEAFDSTTNNISLDTDDKWDALSKVIKNVATPVSGNDAVNKTYADANAVLTAADVVSAEAAKVAAELAETGAETAESNAQAVLAQMQILYDDWDDRYLGSKASDPTLDNDGDALIDGALYFNTTSNNMRVYDLGTTTWLVLDSVIADDSITNTQLANMAQATIKGRASGAGTGDPTDLTAAQGRTILDVYSTSEVDSAVASGAGGLVDIQYFTTSGTWTKPAGTTKVFYQLVGGGGEGESSGGTTGAAGTPSSFGSHGTGNGGAGGQAANVGGTATGGNLNFSGSGATTGKGADAPRGFGIGGAAGLGNDGTGYGSGGSSNIIGGASGGYVEEFLTSGIGATETVTVGVGGGGTTNGGDGADGIVIVYSYK